MDRDALVARRGELAGELARAQAVALRLQGAIAVLDELLAEPDPATEAKE